MPPRLQDAGELQVTGWIDNYEPVFVRSFGFPRSQNRSIWTEIPQIDAACAHIGPQLAFGSVFGNFDSSSCGSHTSLRLLCSLSSSTSGSSRVMESPQNQNEADSRQGNRSKACPKHAFCPESRVLLGLQVAPDWRRPPSKWGAGMAQLRTMVCGAVGAGCERRRACRPSRGDRRGTADRRC